MSPLLLSHPQMLSFPRPSLTGHAFTQRYRSHVECFSSSSQKIHIPPTIIYNLDPFGRGFGRPLIMIEGFLWDLHKKVPMELAKKKGMVVGGSHGWVATLLKDCVLRLQDDLNPSASDSNPKRISLMPPLVTLPHCQTQIVTNVAMSSSDPEEDDSCVVAIKFLGPQLSLWSKNSGWVNIDTRNPSFYSSPVMFSVKEKMFRIASSGGHVIGSWDLKNHMQKPKLQNVRFRNLPKLTKSKWGFLDSCSRTEHLVESPGGEGYESETFMVKWYKKKTKGYAKMVTKAIMVFKIDEEGNAVYTKNIGDLCIFLSISEPFCIPAASCGDSFIDPNNVYFQTYDEDGCVDITYPFDVYTSPNGFQNSVPFYIPRQTTEYSLTTEPNDIPWPGNWREEIPPTLLSRLHHILAASDREQLPILHPELLNGTTWFGYTRAISKKLRQIMRYHLNTAASLYFYLPQQEKNEWFLLFANEFNWAPEHTETVWTAFHICAERHYHYKFIYGLKVKWVNDEPKPEWMDDQLWAAFIEKWNEQYKEYGV